MKVKNIARQVFQFLHNFFRSLGFDFERIRTIRPWEDDKTFVCLAQKVNRVSVVDVKRLYILSQVVKATSQLPGEAIELGVYKGGSAFLIGSYLNKITPSKKLYLFDTFQGLPPPNKTLDPAYRGGEFQDVEFDKVKLFLKKIKNVVFHKGLFKDTLNSVKNHQFSFIHIDADLYQSVKEACEFLYDRTVPGSVWVFDDYGFKKHLGAKKAVDDFFKKRPEKPILLPTGQAILIKQK